MNSKTAYACSWLLVAGSLLAGLYFYPQLPQMMTAHWSAAVVANGAIPLFWGVATMPLICAAIIGIFWLIPKIDPLHRNIAEFRSEYNIVLVVLVLALTVIQFALLAYNLGIAFDMRDVLWPTIGVLFFVIGTVLPATRRNWFFGIRTPWTVSSDVVWQKTHRLGGILFQIVGVIGILELFVPAADAQYAMPIFFAPLAIAIVWTVAYSYVVFSRMEASIAHPPASV